MTADPAPLAPFDDDVVSLVADRHDVTEERLRELLARHQEQARANPGVENLVYEWRSQFHDQPLVQRTEDTYYLKLRDHVWAEFADALDISDAGLDAVLDAHAEQARADTDATVTDDHELMVLGRT